MTLLLLLPVKGVASKCIAQRRRRALCMRQRLGALQADAHPWKICSSEESPSTPVLDVRVRKA